MRSRTLPELPGRCKRCYLVEAWCLCACVPTVQTRVGLTVLRHFLETPKSTNTARIAALALPRCEVVEFQEPNAALDARLAQLKDAWVLFPGEGAAPEGAPANLVVLDGTWRQARKMMKKIPALARMPRYPLSPPVRARQRLRQSPHPENRSTLEAIADALSALESPEAGEQLLRLHELLVERTLRARGQASALQGAPLDLPTR